MLLLCACRSVVEVDVVNSSLSTDDQLTFPRQQQQQQQQQQSGVDSVDNDDDESWKQSLGFIRLSASNLVTASAGNVTPVLYR